MNSMTKINESLKQNDSITNNQIKEYLEQLIQVFNDAFPNVSLENLAELLKDIQISSGSKFFYKEAIQYDTLNNMIVINQELLQKEGTDVRHSMMKVLLSMITSKDNSYGLGKNEKLTALNVGLREVIANNLVGNEGTSEYLDEQVLVNSIGESIGADVFLNAFFTNDPSMIVRELLTRCGSMERLDAFLSQMNNNMYTRNQTKTSILYHLQTEAARMGIASLDYVMGTKVMEDGSGIKYSKANELEQFIKEQTTDEKVK